MTRIILASQSPRRKELLDKMGLTFTTIPSNYEEHLDESRSAEDVAKELALGKALDVAASHPDAYVIGSDTIVAIGGRQMEKPVNIEDAREMLTALASHKSTVSTGLAVVNLANNVQIADVDTARVFFKPDSIEVSELRETYLASNDWKDKAGGYGIQSGAAVLIERIEGNYDTIVGLPTIKLSKILGSLGVNAKVS
jgi:septum formation protein